MIIRKRRFFESLLFLLYSIALSLQISWSVFIHSVHISCNKLNFGVLILLSTVVIDRDPAAQRNLGFVLIESDNIVCFPGEPRGPVGDQTIDPHRPGTPHLPDQRGQRDKPVGELL